MLLPQTRRFPISIRFLAQPLLDRDSVRCPSVWAHRRRVNKQRFRGQRRGTNCKNTRLCGSSASIAVNIGTQTDCGNGRLRRHDHHHLTLIIIITTSQPAPSHSAVQWKGVNSRLQTSWQRKFGRLPLEIEFRSDGDWNVVEYWFPFDLSLEHNLNCVPALGILHRNCVDGYFPQCSTPAPSTELCERVAGQSSMCVSCGCTTIQWIKEIGSVCGVNIWPLPGTSVDWITLYGHENKIIWH